MPISSNFTFELVAISEVNEILILLAANNCTFFSVYYYFWAGDETFQV